MPSADSQTCLVVPPTTTRNKVRAYTAVVESKTKIDEEQLGLTNAAVYDDFAYLEGAMVHTDVQDLLVDVSMVESGGAMDSQIPNKNAETERVGDRKTLPQTYPDTMILLPSSL